ncbi:MAG: hypothetical protein QF747_03275, partial [Patescibacteria group bacterium]|nr:hypothetical protein [Patescibacteria group bacterium]
DKKKFYINGKWISPSKPNDLEVINPSNEDPYAIISLGFKEDVDKKDLFSLEDFKQGYQCDLKITNLQFPPLD